VAAIAAADLGEYTPLWAVLDSTAPGVFCFDASFFKKNVSNDAWE